MRPTPNEVAEGLRRILVETVRPALDDDYAQARLDEVRAVLAQVDWNDAGLRLLREHQELVALAHRVGEAIGSVPPDVPHDSPLHHDHLAAARVALDGWMVDQLDTVPDSLRVEVESFYLG